MPVIRTTGTGFTNYRFPHDPECLDLVRNYSLRTLDVGPSYFRAYFKIEKVIFNPPATIVFWTDGAEKTVVKRRADETFDKEKGLAMAICKRLYGDQFHKVFKEWCKEECE